MWYSSNRNDRFNTKIARRLIGLIMQEIELANHMSSSGFKKDN